MKEDATVFQQKGRRISIQMQLQKPVDAGI